MVLVRGRRRNRRGRRQFPGPRGCQVDVGAAAHLPGPGSEGLSGPLNSEPLERSL